jgi:predicted DsbA family dithiol-disulfide isomerase
LYSNLVGGVSGVPTTFFFNQNSELLGYLVGAQPKDVWIRIIEDLLSQME